MLVDSGVLLVTVGTGVALGGTVVEVLYGGLRPWLGYASEDYCAVAVGVVEV